MSQEFNLFLILYLTLLQPDRIVFAGRIARQGDPNLENGLAPTFAQKLPDLERTIRSFLKYYL